MTEELKIWTFKEFCEVLKTNQNTVKTWKRKGELPEKLFFKIGGTLYVLQDVFKAWVKEKTNWKGDYYGNL